jgi:hypothetical protein
MRPNLTLSLQRTVRPSISRRPQCPTDLFRRGWDGIAQQATAAARRPAGVRGRVLVVGSSDPPSPSRHDGGPPRPSHLIPQQSTSSMTKYTEPSQIPGHSTTTGTSVWFGGTVEPPNTQVPVSCVRPTHEALGTEHTVEGHLQRPFARPIGRSYSLSTSHGLRTAPPTSGCASNSTGNTSSARVRACCRPPVCGRPPVRRTPARRGRPARDCGCSATVCAVSRAML